MKTLEEIKEDLEYWFLDKPKDLYLSIRHWFYCNWNMDHFRLVKAAFMSYPWDHSYLLRLEELQIKKALSWFEKHQTATDEYHIPKLNSLRIAHTLLHRINHQDEWYDYVPYENEEEMAKDGRPDKLDRMLNITPMKYIYNGPRVNRRNMDRFMSKEELKVIGHFHDDDLYVIKAKSLYYKIRDKYTDTWWD